MKRFYNGCMLLHQGAEDKECYLKAAWVLNSQGRYPLERTLLDVVVGDTTVCCLTTGHMHFDSQYAWMKYKEADDSTYVADGVLRGGNHGCRTKEFGLMAGMTLSLTENNDISDHCQLLVITELGDSIKVHVRAVDNQLIEATSYHQGTVAFCNWQEKEPGIVGYLIENLTERDISLVVAAN